MRKLPKWFSSLSIWPSLYTNDEGKIQVSLPENAPNEINSVVVVELAGLPEAAVML